MSSSDRYTKMSQALRENLLKRKQQTRAKRASIQEPPPSQIIQSNESPTHPTEDATDARPTRRRLWGRSLARPLSDAQKKILSEGMIRMGIAIPPAIQNNAYPIPHSVHWDATFWTDYAEYALEIGFGDGEHLVNFARAHPATGVIGAERFINGLVACLESVLEDTLTNVRIFPDDAGFLWQKLPKQSLHHVYILFPDPWPKKRHHKRRLIQPAFLKTCYEYLAPGGKIWIASDIPDYIATSRAAFHVVHELYAFCGEHPAPVTKYGRKALREGRSSTMLCYSRNTT